ncbi:MAG: IPT/TIG domain-containing protein, partial [Anaerolineales bacterium]|nr:IPT/TIG domain-containing protein [Anaerolineales bacterium]
MLYDKDLADNEAEGGILNIIDGLKERLRRLDTAMIVYRVYFLLATVSAMLFVILVQSFQVDEQTVALTQAAATQAVIQTRISSLQNTIAAHGQTCDNMCGTSVADAVLRAAAPAIPTPIPTAMLTPTPPSTQTATALPTVTASATPLATITATTTGTPTATATATATNTVTSSSTPTLSSPTATPTEPPESPAPTPPTITIDSIVPSSIEQGSSEIVTVTGSNFTQDMTVTLGTHSITPINITSTSFQADVSQVQVGLYNLIATHNDRETGQLENALTVYEPVANSQNTLEYAFPVIYGADIDGTRIRENVLLIFIDIPTSTMKSVYIHIQDPNASASGNFDKGELEDY